LTITTASVSTHVMKSGGLENSPLMNSGNEYVNYWPPYYSVICTIHLNIII
jgi:hypothetical protein